MARQGKCCRAVLSLLGTAGSPASLPATPRHLPPRAICQAKLRRRAAHWVNMACQEAFTSTTKMTPSHTAMLNVTGKGNPAVTNSMLPTCSVNMRIAQHQSSPPAEYLGQVQPLHCSKGQACIKSVQCNSHNPSPEVLESMSHRRCFTSSGMRNGCTRVCSSSTPIFIHGSDEQSTLE